MSGTARATPEPHKTVGRRLTALPLVGFSSEDGPGYGFRVNLFGYDGESIPYRWATAVQAYVTTKGKWAHMVMLDCPEIRPGERIEILLRHDKEDSGNYFGELSDDQIKPFSREEQTFRHVYPTLTANWIRTMQHPWGLRVGTEIGYTKVTPNASDGGLPAQLNPLGVDGGWLYSLEGALRYDTRRDYVDTKSGLFEEITLRYSLGNGGNYHGGQIIHDHRHFIGLGESWVLGQRLKTTISFGDLPFYEKPKLGSSRTVRGLAADRHRDGGRILLNSELRWRGLMLHEKRSLLGGIGLFVDGGHVFSPSGGPRWSGWKWSVGGGPRIYWYSTIVRLDIGVTNGNSELYMRFAQVF